jgi:tyrosine-protein kinase Etk/Wzc
MEQPALIASAAEPLRPTPEPVRERSFPEPAVPPRPLQPRPRTPPPRRSQPSLAEYLWTLRQGLWLVLAITAGAVAAGVLYLGATRPVYRASALLQVQHRARSVTGLDDVPGAPIEKPPADAETESLRSRVIVGAVVDALHVEREVQPRVVPVLGPALARLHRGEGLAPAPAQWLAGFAWGGERIAIDRLEVPPPLQDQRLQLTALEGGRWRLVDAAGGPLLEGSVGVTAETSAGGGRLAVRIAELVARPGTGFVVRVQRRDDAIEAIREDLRVQEKGRDSGVLLLELDGRDPALASAVLDGITSTYLRRDAERKADDAARKLKFVDAQLPALRHEMERAEGALNAFRVRNGTVDLSAETKALLDRSAALSKESTELQLSRSEMLQSFNDGHPAVSAASRKLGLLQAEQEAVSARLRALPQAEATLAQLETAALRARDLHDTLAKKAQDFRLARAVMIPDGWIIDPPVAPLRPARPRAGLVLALATLLGLLGGIATVLARASARDGAEDADDVEEVTGLAVLATVPHSDGQAAIRRRARKGGGPVAQLFDMAPRDRAVEAIRTLRAGVQVALAAAPNAVVAVTSPVPEVGRSFVVANLAFALAGTGQRVLLVDADLRQGRLQRLLGLKPSIGLAGVLAGAGAVDPAIVHVDGQLHVLPAGELPPRPGELLAGRPFEAFLLGQASRYDVVVVNTPPVLAVADALAVGRLAGVNLMVVRAGAHGERELAAAAKQLEVGGVRLQGFVLNDVRARGGRYGKGGRDRQYVLRAPPGRP